MRAITAGTPEAVRGERLILAAKAAIAASIAWLLAPYVPFAASEYSYYAPLGVLISMHPTVVGSARAGAQSLAGLGIGILLGLGALSLVRVGVPAVVGIAAVIAIGIVLGGIRRLGAGRDWVAIAGLFVLLLGGRDADEFSLSYLMTTAFGVVIGILMNLIVIPPLFLGRASDQLTALRTAVSDVLRDVAGSLENGDIDGEAFTESADRLASLLTQTKDEVRVAEESSRANPRSRGRSADRQLNARRLLALERTTRATIDLADMLVRTRDEGSAADRAIAHSLAEAARASADVVAAPAGDEEVGERLAAAGDALDRSVQELDRLAAPTGAPAYSRAYAYAAAVSVRRIVDASHEFVYSAE